MNEINALIHSPTFWLVSVVLALILSVLGNWLTRLIDKGWFVGKAMWSERSKKASEKRNRYIIELAENPEALNAAIHSVSSLRYMSVYIVLLAVSYRVTPYLSASSGLANLLANVGVAAGFFVSFLVFLRVERDSKRIREAYYFRDMVSMKGRPPMP